MTGSAPGNRPERLQWFNGLGFGMFIHWSIDSQIGSVIGHSMARASEDYLAKYTRILPATFNPKRFDPDEWAALARLAGMRYVVFTTKHHSGFCMFHTRSTRFSVADTPFGRDVTGEIVEAFRRQGIAIGLYHSPDDFHFLHGKGLPLRRGVRPEACEGLLEHNQAQVRELLTNYGDIDIMFFDGPSDGLRELCWELRPEIVVTRGAIRTPEQRIPGVQSPEPWEACVTMGTGWQYKPTNESYKSGTQLIELLIETRAKGGNLVLNVGPKPNGELPIEQEALLREIALWTFVNGEAIYDVEPWRVPCEGGIWFAAEKGGEAVYAFLEGEGPWPLYERREWTLTSVRAGPGTKVQVLGQADDLADEQGPAIEWSQEEDGLRIRAARMQRLYNNRRWPNPVVLRITDARAGLVPPAVVTGEALWDAASSSWLLQASLADLGEEEAVEAGFQYRPRRLLTDALEDWVDTAFESRRSTGEYAARVEGLTEGTAWEFRAVVRHPAITVNGDSVTFRT